MPVTFIHTADWQIGKPFAGVVDAQKRAMLQDARVQAIRKIGNEARERGAEFVVVCGDLFDSVTPTNSVVAAACRAIGEVGLPVFVIPGNHDHGGAGSVWHQEFFQREQAQLAPNLRVLLSHDPVELENCVLFPCPLLRRHELTDPTQSLRSFAEFDRFGSKPRIALAHGTTMNFGEKMDDEEDFSGSAENVIDLGRLPAGEFDYVALGDWHGTKQVAPNAWYSGTPEPDRFPKGTSHAQGNVLLVRAGRQSQPEAEQVSTQAVSWQEIAFHFADRIGPAELDTALEEALAGAGEKALIRLQLEGAIDFNQADLLAKVLESWEARLIRIKLEDRTVIAPSTEELESLTTRAEDPLIARVARRLTTLAEAGQDDSAAARLALRELYLMTGTR